MIPLRRLLIVQAHGELPYPEGTACAAGVGLFGMLFTAVAARIVGILAASGLVAGEGLA